MLTFADLTAQQTANEQRIQSIKAKRSQLKAFKGLPPVCFSLRHLSPSSLFIPSISLQPNLFLAKKKSLILNSMQNLDLARQQLKTARAAQMELIQLREGLLGRMAESVV